MATIKDEINVQLVEDEIVNVKLNTIDYVTIHDLGAISNVVFTNISDKQVLYYDSTNEVWKNIAVKDLVKLCLISNEPATRINSTQYQTANDYNSDFLEVFLNGVKIDDSVVTKDDDDLFSLPITILLTDKVTVNYIKK